MQTITIDILDNKVIRLLQDLEFLNLIRLPNDNTSTATDAIKKPKPSDYRGSISKETADKLHAHIVKSRKEWNNDF